MYYIIIIFFIITLYKLYNNRYKDKNIDIIFNYLFIPLLIYYSIGHLLLTKSTAKSIGWESNGFQLELGYITLSILLMSLYISYKNKSSLIKIYIINIWILFSIFASLNHIKELYYKKNKSFNNIYPIFITYMFAIIVLKFNK